MSIAIDIAPHACAYLYNWCSTCVMSAAPGHQRQRFDRRVSAHSRTGAMQDEKPHQPARLGEQ
eukprot:18066-Eustigmatos_ZCMA.PRE.1